MRMNERRTKMSSVKRKLTNKTLVQKCEIIRHIEKGMTNKEASERFGVPKNTISTWIKNKEKLLAAFMAYYITGLTNARLEAKTGGEILQNENARVSGF